MRAGFFFSFIQHHKTFFHGAAQFPSSNRRFPIDLPFCHQQRIFPPPTLLFLLYFCFLFFTPAISQSLQDIYTFFTLPLLSSNFSFLQRGNTPPLFSLLFFPHATLLRKIKIKSNHTSLAPIRILTFQNLFNSTPRVLFAESIHPVCLNNKT